MAFIGESREDLEHPWGRYVCLDKEDSKVLSQIIGLLVARKLRTFEYYRGIHESGEATVKQTDKLYKAEEEYDAVLSIQNALLKYIGK